MSGETVLRNARIVTAEAVIDGHLVVRDGRIAEVAAGATALGEDMEGDFLLPGLVELHTDHVEGHLLPRPGVTWDRTAALQAHDAQVAASGITTVFEALRVGLGVDAEIAMEDWGALAGAIVAGQADGRLRAEHFIHLRCEVSADDALAGFAHFVGNPLLKLVSLMDHAPGQRQFARLEAYRAYYQVKYRMTDAEFDAFCADRIAESDRNSGPNRRAIAGHCRAAGIPLASHDDATRAHVEEAVADGISLAEFPTTLESASASHAAGLRVLMGAPNIVRGRSHSGNISALDLLRAGVLDILSSDYVPFSLMQAVFVLADAGEASLPAAVNLVSKTPAESVGLHDRGAIAAGRRADLVRVARRRTGPPVVRAVHVGGRRVS